MSNNEKVALAIHLPADEELSDEIREKLSALPPLNVFRLMAAAPASFNAFLDIAVSILFESELDARKREIAVLRVAHTTGSNYEWVQHVSVAKQCGVTEEEIEQIGVNTEVSGLDEEGNLLCRVADEISNDIRLSDDALEQVLDRFGQRQTAELILCCSYFNMLSRVLESSRLPLEQQAEP